MNTRRVLGVAAGIVMAISALASPAGAATNAVTGVRYTIIGPNATNVSWLTPPLADHYTVYVNGSLAATTAPGVKRIEVTLNSLLGPKDLVQANAIAADGTIAARVTATYWSNGWVAFPRPLRFATTGMTLTSTQTANLRAFLALLAQHGLTDVKAVGHNAGVVGAPGAYALGKARARLVLSYLSSHGTVSTFWSSWGNGAPLANNDTAAGRAFNRRVELFVR
ncbi:MAG: OmpA family protein [Candidatus Nanopelagicales bacterium]